MTAGCAHWIIQSHTYCTLTLQHKMSGVTAACREAPSVTPDVLYGLKQRGCKPIKMLGDGDVGEKTLMQKGPSPTKCFKAAALST